MNLKRYLNHKFVPFDEYHYHCIKCDIYVYHDHHDKLILMDKMGSLVYNTEILSCNEQQIKNLLE